MRNTKALAIAALATGGHTAVVVVPAGQDSPTALERPAVGARGPSVWSSSARDESASPHDDVANVVARYGPPSGPHGGAPSFWPDGGVPSSWPDGGGAPSIFVTETSISDVYSTVTVTDEPASSSSSDSTTTTTITSSSTVTTITTTVYPASTSSSTANGGSSAPGGFGSSSTAGAEPEVLVTSTVSTAYVTDRITVSAMHTKPLAVANVAAEGEEDSTTTDVVVVQTVVTIYANPTTISLGKRGALLDEASSDKSHCGEDDKVCFCGDLIRCPTSGAPPLAIAKRSIEFEYDIVTVEKTSTTPAVGTTTVIVTGSPPPPATGTSYSTIGQHGNGTRPKHSRHGMKEGGKGQELVYTEVSNGVAIVQTTVVAYVTAPLTPSVPLGPGPAISEPSSTTAPVRTLTDPINPHITIVVSGDSTSFVGNTSTLSYKDITMSALAPPSDTSSASTTANSSSSSQLVVTTSTQAKMASTTSSTMGNVVATSTLGSDAGKMMEFSSLHVIPAAMVAALALCFGIALLL